MERAAGQSFPQVFALMERSFPTTEYRERHRQEALFGCPAYRLYMQREQGNLAGFLAAWEFSSFRFIEHLAVDPALRGNGLGKTMVQEYLAYDNRPVFLEVELPKTALAQRRIRFYQRVGLRLNTFEYFQQPLRAGDSPMPLLIMSWPDPVTEQSFAPYKRVIYRQVYGVE